MSTQVNGLCSDTYTGMRHEITQDLRIEETDDSDVDVVRRHSMEAGYAARLGSSMDANLGSNAVRVLTQAPGHCRKEE